MRLLPAAANSESRTVVLPPREPPIPPHIKPSEADSAMSAMLPPFMAVRTPLNTAPLPEPMAALSSTGAAEPPDSRTTPVNAIVTPTPTATFFQSMFLTNSTTSSLTRFAVVQKCFTVFSTEAVQEFRMLSASFSLDLPQLCRVSPVFWVQIFA